MSISAAFRCRILGLALVAGCGGGTTTPSPAPPPPPPPPPPPAPVATVELSRATDSLLIGQTEQLVATTKDAAGNTLSGRTVTWATNAASVATVSTTGLVTAAGAGAATITASSEGKDASAAVTVFDPKVIPAFVKPFAEPADLWTSNYHDHDVPKEFVDNNGTYVSYWGESALIGIDGHQGYDWRLPVGTPIKAVMAGTVLFAGDETPFFCPILNATVAGKQVRLEHRLPGGLVIRTVYAHFSQIDVTVNGSVTAGQTIGLSGGTGCALQPHLHFEARRPSNGNAQAYTPVDPFGWSGAGADPWASMPEGGASIDLWKPNEAPSLFRRIELPLPAVAGPFFQLTRVQFQGVRDDQNPNNEYLEVARDDRVAPASLDIGGATIRTKAGLVFTFPAGTTLTAANPRIRIYSGSGTASPSTLYWGRTAGVWNNLTDCARVANSGSQPRGELGWGTPGCS